MRIRFIVLPLVIFTFVMVMENADAQGPSIVRPMLVDGQADGTQVAKPGEYQIKVGDFLELNSSYPVAPAAEPEDWSSTSSNTDVLTNGGVKPVVVPGLEDTAQKMFRFRARSEGTSDITLNIGGNEYQYSIRVEKGEEVLGRPRRIEPGIGPGIGRVPVRGPRNGEAKGEAALGKGSYKAIQIQNTVHLFANGMNPTPGHKAYFEKAMIEIWPPQFSLMVERPAGMVAQVMTPFSAHTSFTAGEPLESITITDRDGQHEVEVLQLK